MPKTLPELCKEAWNDAIAAGVPVASWSNIEWLYNQSIGRSWGCCSKTLLGYTISLSSVLCKHTSESSILNTAIHELIHTTGAHGHRHEFKQWAAVVNRAYPGKYNVSRCAGVEEKMSLEEAKTVYPYIVSCPKCGAFWEYKRLGYHVRNPQTCWCPHCKKKTGKIIRLVRTK